MAATQVRVLQLHPGETLDTKLFRLQKGWTVRFTLNPAFHAFDVHLYCNHPAPGSFDFDRFKYRKLPWINPTKCRSDNGDRFAEITVHLPGVFHFYIGFGDGSTDRLSGLSSESKSSGFFTVDPTLHINSSETLPLDCVSVQTVISKCLGPISEWKGRLQVAKETGYNMIHFTPIQQLGGSCSAYSLLDQLKLNPSFDNPGGKKTSVNDVDKFLCMMRKDWKVLSIVDIVLNHTANESPWLRDHPECSYNCENSPHLRPAFLVDRLLWHFSCDVADGKWAERGVPPELCKEEHIQALGAILRELIPQLSLWEFFAIDVERTVELFKQAVLKKGKSTSGGSPHSGLSLDVINHHPTKRFPSEVDIDKAIKMFNIEQPAAGNEKERIRMCCDMLRDHLLGQNEQIKHGDTVRDHIEAIVGNTQAHIRYEFVDPNGKRHPKVKRETPLITCYFTFPGDDQSLEEEEKVMMSEKGKHCMVHQGWIMGGDVLADFAAPGSFRYLRREVVCWGDSVKLRYGQKPEDVPFLWDHMLKYTEMCARLFDGVRLDNCHSLPLHVGQYFLDAARRVKPDLYVIAELFTGSEAQDNIFVNNLGITSLIREAMSAHDAHEQGRLVYRYGGEPVGAFMHPSALQPLVPCIAHAVYMDVTHDNMAPIQVRSVYDAMPSSGLVAMACCASGSSRGYDELVPHHISVVTDSRRYLSWPGNNPKLPVSAFVSPDSGILSAKRAINELHRRLGEGGYSQVYVDQIHPDVHAITRHCPGKRRTVVLVAHSAFRHPPPELQPTKSHPAVTVHGIPALSIPGDIEEVIFEAILIKKNSTEEFCKDEEFINGLQSYEVHMQEHLKVEKSTTCRVEPKGTNMNEVHFTNFPPGSVIAFDISMEPPVKKALGMLRHLGCELCNVNTGDAASQKIVKELDDIISKLSLTDLNRILYRCDPEEKDDGNGGGVYVLPHVGAMTYCGLQGFISVLSHVRPNNDTAHPICVNLREGNWMLDYMVERIRPFHGTKPLADWLDNVFSYVKECPRYLVPCYFDAIITPVHMKLMNRSRDLMSSLVQEGSVFLLSLAQCSVQLTGLTRGASLPPLSPKLKTLPALMSLAAGLPHFATGFMRCWGRDTFISLRGLLIVTGRYTAARNHILAFAGCVRHGFIPNLLDGGKNPRYNCRDAVWWWLQSIQDYCKIAPEGLKILSDPVSRIFPSDDSVAQKPGVKDMPLYDVIQEVMQRHFIGIQFRERGAGLSLDFNMKDAGFNVSAGVCEETGFVFGGNQWNAGTWMDKVGESESAGNKGVPATPRDGSAVELVGLCKSAVRWLTELREAKIFPYEGVSKTGENGYPVSLTYKEWNQKIQKSFEEKFWIASQPDPTREGEESSLVNRRGIYKDCYGSSHRYSDYQLRPNFCMAMVVAPELFTPVHAWQALHTVETVLLGPLGMKTLDPSDWAHHGVYDNSGDSSEYKIARGFSYHQGPEWLWCTGPFLRARLHFAREVNGQKGLTEAVAFVHRVLARHKVHIANSPWRSLPELTNAGGEFCPGSCEAQAWSMACLLDVYYDMEQMLKN